MSFHSTRSVDARQLSQRQLKTRTDEAEWFAATQQRSVPTAPHLLVVLDSLIQSPSLPY